MDIHTCIQELIAYALCHGLIGEDDRAFATNALLTVLHMGGTEERPLPKAPRELADILADVLADAAARGLIDGESVVARDLFDTAVMGALCPRPSEVVRRFYDLYAESPEHATDWFYRFCCDVNYIRTDRIRRDMKWRVPSPYGEIDITVNLSKPEKDPKAIAAAKLLPPSGYPKCLLCHENEGYAGTLSKPARQNLRQIPFDMAGTPWYLQYSPYVYYNEHCIALSSLHTPMKVDRSSFEKELEFVTCFPHYFIGQNADLPIVGGSILTHDHMQGGRYTFAMERAAVEEELSFPGYPQIRAGFVRWPMSVIRLTGTDREALVLLADTILRTWRGYSDPDAGIYAETEGEPHNTITPIARRRGEAYELDLVLRNNITTKEHPLGVFHPHAQYHNIKKENIGLIEVMGLAVLPSRLKGELALMEDAILHGRDFATVPGIEKHAAWFAAFRDRYEFTAGNTADILRREVGNTFLHVLEDAGVYKATDEGRAARRRFAARICDILEGK